jgi:S1-C subfamily serine protease
MSNRNLKAIAVIAAVVIVFSAFSAILMFDNIRVQEQLSAQEKQISDLQNVVEQLNEIQSSLNQSITQNEAADDLQSALAQLDAQKEQIQTALEQAATNEEQISELQGILNDVKQGIEEAASNLLGVSSQINALNQSTSTGLAEIEDTVETLEGLLSELSDLETIVDQLLNLTPTEVYEAAYRSVVVIRTPVGQGSGFIYNNPSTIVTNYHVVTNETDIEIEFFDRTRIQATVIGSDAYADVAVLHVSTSPAEATPLTFGNQSNIGQQVAAIGNPLGLTESLSVGYISQVNRLLDLEPIIIPVLQLDLTIAAGSSGGPLLDMTGKVVGITNAGTDVGFNFAVPVNVAKTVVSAIIEEGEYKHPLVGFSIIELSPEVISYNNIVNVDSSQTGLMVVEVVPDYPADEAGIEPVISGVQGYTAVDIVLAVDGHDTLTLEEWSAYMEVEVSTGQTVTLTLWRSGAIEQVDVTTTERPPYEE